MQDKRLHDLVATATRENWTSVRAYSEQLEAIVAQVIADGQVHGEFRKGDPMTVARCIVAATEFYTNPLVIGASARFARPTPDQMREFCVRGLREVWGVCTASSNRSVVGRSAQLPLQTVSRC